MIHSIYINERFLGMLQVEYLRFSVASLEYVDIDFKALKTTSTSTSDMKFCHEARDWFNESINVLIYHSVRNTFKHVY